MPLPDLSRHQTCTWHTDIHADQTLIHIKNAINKSFKKYLFHVCEYFAYMYLCAAHMCLVPVEIRRESQILWNQSYKVLRVATWVLATTPGSSARAANVLNHKAMAQALIKSS